MSNLLLATGLEVQVSLLMTGLKNPILCGNKLTVSPAMYELMCDPNELEGVLRSMKPIVLPDLAKIRFRDLAPTA
jgi:hypothetical protein